MSNTALVIQIAGFYVIIPDAVLFIAAISVTAALVLFVAAYLIVRWLRKKKILKSLLGQKLLLIRLLFKISDDPKKALEEINLSSQLFVSLSNQNIPFTFEIAVSAVGEHINFYLAVPAHLVESTKRIVNGLWPDAQVDEVEEFTVFNPAGSTALAYLQLADHYALPLRTYSEIGLDTFLTVLNNFTKLQLAGEGLALQIMVKSAPKHYKDNITKFLYNVRGGVKLLDALRGAVIPKKKPPKAGETPMPEERVVIDEAGIKLLEQKLKSPLLMVNYRVVASATSDYQANSILESVIKAFDQYASTQGNSIKVLKLKPIAKNFFNFIFRNFDQKQTMMLNSEELASVIHLPTAGTNVPKINWIFSKEASPPLALPSRGVLIGYSKYRNEAKPVYVTEEDRRRHVYVIGQTGTGKSTLLINMAREDIVQGKGVAVIDPHGDLIDSILGLIPQNRIDDVVLFDPGDLERPFGLNMLEYDPSKPEQKTFIVNEMQSIFNRLFAAESMGPIFEQYMRNTLQLLMEDLEEPATLLEVPRVFTDEKFREQKVARAKNPVVIDFWEKEATKVTGEASLSNMAPYITSKFNNFIANDYMRPIIGQRASSFNFRSIMDEGKILLVNLSKGKIGDINAGLLGMIIVGRLLLAAFSRVDVPQEARRDFNLYIDEFQNFTTDSISTILSEARKYRLNLVIAHQFIAQLLEKIRDAVFGNVGSMVVFRIGAADAEFIEKSFAPVFNKNDFVNIPNFTAYAKLLINGQVSQPFNISTTSSPKPDSALRDKIREFSRLKYGRPRKEVEEEVMKRLRV